MTLVISMFLQHMDNNDFFHFRKLAKYPTIKVDLFLYQYFVHIFGICHTCIYFISLSTHFLNLFSQSVLYYIVCSIKLRSLLPSWTHLVSSRSHLQFKVTFTEISRTFLLNAVFATFIILLFRNPHLLEGSL